ncbi:MAG: cytochrome c biogenesis protein CcdA, partial [Verrucomicrobiota bacterium]
DVFSAVLAPGAGANPDPGDIYFFESSSSPQLEYLMPEVTSDGPARILKMKRTETDEAPSAIDGFFYASKGWTADGKTKALSLPANRAGEAGIEGEGDAGSAEYVTLDGKSEKKLTVGRALLLAFIGGLLLNLMPCVFPVLGIKIMGFVQQAGDEPAKIKIYGFVFAAGLVLSLWILAGILVAVNLAGKQMGWGFQLSSPGFLAFIIILLFLMALNLFGLFEIGTSLMGVGSQSGTQKGYSGSFWSGVLTTLIATPCSGPFLGTTMGFTLQQSIPIAFLIFTALALGIAAPYVILSLNPNLIKKLPKPGGWMITFKKLMAFPLLATVIYFLNAFAHQKGREGLIMLLACILVAGIAVWVYGSWCTPARQKATRLRGLVATLLISLVAIFYGRKAISSESEESLLKSELALVQEQLQESVKNGGKIAGKEAVKDGLQWLDWSPDRIRDLRAEGRMIFVDYTASW